MKKKLRLGVIGVSVGRRGQIVEFQLPSERARITAVVDSNPESIADYKSRHGDEELFCTHDYRAMLARQDVDAVCIMVNDSQHKKLAIESLEAGKAVFLEKPMAITIEDCDQILKTAYLTGNKLFLGHNMRYMKFVLKMKEIIDSGLIGEIQSVWVRHFINYGSTYFRHWCAEQSNCTGLLLQKGAHDIDIIHWLCGSYTRRVIGMGKLSVYNQTQHRLKPGEKPDRGISMTPECWPPLELTGLSPKLDVEDHNMIMMQLQNGVQASLTQSFYAPDSERNYTFIGTRGRIENIGDFDGETEINVWTRRGSRQKPDIIYKLNNSGDGHGGADRKMLESFVDFVQGGSQPHSSPLAARNAVAVGVIGHASMRGKNMPKEIPPVPAYIAKYFNDGQIKDIS